MPFDVPALVRTVSDRPLSFIDRYNEVAEDELAVHRFDRPAALSPLSRLLQETKVAVLEHDEARFGFLWTRSPKVQRT